jgi:hypothetical protein
MAYRRGVKIRGWMILVFGGAAAAAGCQTVCTGSCASPGDYLFTPAGLPAALVDVTADSPCVAKLWPADGGPGEVEVTDDSATSGAICVLRGHLADGQLATATVIFGQSNGDSCCPSFAPSGGKFTLSPAGNDGG